MQESDLVLPGVPSRKEEPRLVRLVVLFMVSSAVAALAAIAVPNIRNAVKRERVRGTMGDIQSVATAWECFATDNKVYCPPGLEISRYRWDNVRADTLRRWLEPVYIRKLPSTDGWGRPLQFAVQCGKAGAGFFAIRSSGPDGIWFDDPQFEGSDEIRDYDIVYANGGFFLGDRAYSKAASKSAPARSER